MTVEQVLEELLKPYKFQISQTTNNDNNNYYYNDKYDKIIEITGIQISLHQWKEIEWNTTTVDLCDPNSLQIIEDWAKS